MFRRSAVGAGCPGLPALARFFGKIARSGRFTKLPPACVFLQKVFARKDIVKGVICHGLWLFSPVAELVKGRKMTVHNNLLGDAKNYGVEYVDADVCDRRRLGFGAHRRALLFAGFRDIENVGKQIKPIKRGRFFCPQVWVCCKAGLLLVKTHILAWADGDSSIDGGTGFISHRSQFRFLC